MQKVLGLPSSIENTGLLNNWNPTGSLMIMDMLKEEGLNWPCLQLRCVAYLKFCSIEKKHRLYGLCSFLRSVFIYIYYTFIFCLFLSFRFEVASILSAVLIIQVLKCSAHAEGWGYTFRFLCFYTF